MGNVVMLLVLVGDIRLTWSFSALTVLIYYALTNLSALQLPGSQRLYPRAVSWLGLVGCLSLTVYIEPGYWLSAALLLALGFGLRTLLMVTRPR